MDEKPEATEPTEATEMIQYAAEAECRFDDVIQGIASSLLNKMEASPGDTIGSYRIIQSIGQGGMGNVYLAERVDGEIEQKVAIKLLRADTHRPGWRDRFLRERQLLASLHHHRIVHVMDAGHIDDGRPFLVMEHVEGVPIDRYVAGIEIRERLNLFVRVCEGVSYAHRQLIIHRDLKPSNILVDRMGQPKLLDFGIAKLLDETSEVTQLAEQLLTPNYASPEQLRGEAQSTATDVYSLGAVLYKLLTGVGPREGASRTPKGEVAPPSRLNPEVPVDLDHVIAKALRAEPEERYGSVEAFAQDVRAVLERRPVSVRAGDIWYWTRRYLRRHLVPAAAGMVVVGSLTAGLWAAERERRIAETRFTEVRQLANKLFDIDTHVAQLPGGSKTRQLIVDTALEYLRRVSVDARMEPNLALELGTAYMRVARVQGVNISPNLGQTAQADQTAQKAQELVESVLAAQPGNRTALLRAGQIAHDRMVLSSDALRSGEQVLAFARKSVDRLDQYLSLAPLSASSDRMDAQQVIIAFINASNQYRKADRFDEAISIATRAIDTAHATNWPSQAGAALMVVSACYRAQGRLEDALRAIQESVRQLKPEEGETRIGRLQSYGLALIREGEILGEEPSISMNRPEEAAGRILLALQIAEPLARRDPSDFQSQYRVFLADTKLARIIQHKDPARASELYDDALRRIAGAPGNGSTLRNEAEALAASVYPLLQLGRLAEARRNLNAGLDRLARLKQYPAPQIELGSPAADTLLAQAEYEAARGNPGLAGAECAQLLHLVLAGNPKVLVSLQDAVELSHLYASAARLDRKAGWNRQAAGWEESRRSLWREWNARLPRNAFIMRQMKASEIQ